MKTQQLNEMNKTELLDKLNENLESLQNLKFQQALQQLDDATNIKKTRREIAQIKTVLNEFKIGIRKS
tara:strand:+ start:1744 stop:1947 length:204 start_codon:yes stop_codon:yes gene_type:complete